jgi:tyrosine-protein kinase Etk/Wzc
MTNPMPQQYDFISFRRVVWRRKLLIGALFLVSVAAAGAVSFFLLPKYYKSETMIFCIAPESGGLGAALSASPLAGALAGSIGGLTTPADKILVFLKSRTMAETVIKRFDLLRIFNENRWDAAKGGWKEPGKPPFMEEAVNDLSKQVVSFKKNRDSTVIISVEWKNPKLAADIANYYVTALTECLRDKSINVTIQVVDYAVPAERKSRPIVRLNMLLAGIVSLFVGIIIAFSLEKKA